MTAAMVLVLYPQERVQFSGSQLWKRDSLKAASIILLGLNHFRSQFASKEILVIASPANLALSHRFIPLLLISHFFHAHTPLLIYLIYISYRENY